MTAAEKPCEACCSAYYHSDRCRLNRLVPAHEKLQAENRALETERDTLKESAFHASERAAKAETERDGLMLLLAEAVELFDAPGGCAPRCEYCDFSRRAERALGVKA